jgi:hypothetical protein
MHRKRHDSEAHSFVSLGLLQSRHDHDERMGHVWLFWCGRQTALQEFRGYWPHPEDYAQIPAGQRREYFYEQSARGVITVDYRAKELMRRHKTKCRHASWQIDDAETILLEFICWMPPQWDSREVISRYSCSLARNDWHNCSSWAKSVLDQIGGPDTFFSCAQPKRLKLMAVALWGSLDD